ncbi:hypothetical protein EAY64_17310 [Aquitalea palustris]|uniref:Histidine phosphatase family protein n=1 Tax=Aquitalea palustris TaxID=2480983 RepID=A0A454JEC6_9NEIS|nr:hypothetical protein [Aquitalea palustris]RMC93283.1 hypothetical protein EAY64_17310 [Aquitalea palustris]
MKKHARLLALALGLLWHAASQADQTIVLFRHAEKPAAGLGQLSCQGLNRALALPAVLQRKFARPAALFAPNPGVRKQDGGVEYNYIRPLATIEPTAIRLGLPVNTDYGLDDLAALQAAITSPAYRDATVFVAWEHRLVVKLAAQLLAAYAADPAQVPAWHYSDFDSLYVVTLQQQDGRTVARFRVEQQGLNQQAQSCPGDK